MDRCVKLQRVSDGARKKDRADHEPAAAVFDDQSWKPNRASALVQTAWDRRDQLLADDERVTHRSDDEGSHRLNARRRLPQADKEFPGTESVAQSRIGRFAEADWCPSWCQRRCCRSCVDAAQSS